MSLPEVHLVAGAGTEAVKLWPVAAAVRAARVLDPVLLAAGSRPGAVTRALTAFDARPDVTLPAATLTELMVRLATCWNQRPPAAVLVQGGGPAAVAAALTAAWRRIPLAHLSAGTRHDELAAPDADDTGTRLIAQVAGCHLTAEPMAAMNLLDEGVPALSVLLTGDTGYDAALVMAGRRLPAAQVSTATPYSDGRAAQRAAQAVAALLGLAGRPAPMPVPSFPAAAGATPNGF